MKNPIFKPSISNEDTLDEMISAIMTDNKIKYCIICIQKYGNYALKV